MSLFRKLKSRVRGIIYGLKNIIYYAPVIYNDYDFDHSFFFDLMEFKLRRMEKRMQRFRPEVVKNINIAANLCKRLGNEQYIDWGFTNEYTERRHFKNILERESYLMNQDLDLLGKFYKSIPEVGGINVFRR